MSQPIDYRRPGLASDRGRVIHEQLRLREQGMLAKIALLLVAGMPATFVAPAAATWIAAAVSVRFGYDSAGLWMFLEVSAVLVPILFWLEWRTRGQYYEQGVMGIVATGVSIWMEMSTWQALTGFYGDPEIAGVGWIEICLWGPRQILDAAKKIRMVRSLEHVNRDRVQVVVLRLLSEEHAIEVQNFSDGSPADLGELLAALAYLLVYDWIGASKDGKRVWLTSDSRQRLLGVRK